PGVRSERSGVPARERAGRRRPARRRGIGETDAPGVDGAAAGPGGSAAPSLLRGQIAKHHRIRARGAARYREVAHAARLRQAARRGRKLGGPLVTPRHHVADDLLIDYAAGSLAEGWSLAVATHLSLCPECRARLAAAEAAGGQLMEILRLDPEPDAWAAVRARLGAPETVPTPQPKSAVLPKPLRDYVGGDLETVRWKAIGTAGAQFRFKTGDGRTQVRLL